MIQAIVFDMDGVLVDVTESYRETIVKTVEHFTSQTISRDSIQEYKNQGGWNNDWLLSQKICRDLGVERLAQVLIADGCARRVGGHRGICGDYTARWRRYR